MEIIDISWPVSPEMTVYKDKQEKKPKLTWLRTYDKDNVYESKTEIEAHTGTHVDAPKHFLAEGSSIEAVPLDRLVGNCVVLDLTHVQGKITNEHLQNTQINDTGSIVLLKTSNSSLPETGPFTKEFVYLEKSGAEYLAKKNVKAVGIDYLGIEREQPEHETHKILLGKGILIIEGLRLGHVQPGEYQLVCLPLKVKDAEASPARAILIKK